MHTFKLHFLNSDLQLSAPPRLRTENDNLNLRSLESRALGLLSLGAVPDSVVAWMLELDLDLVVVLHL